MSRWTVVVTDYDYEDLQLEENVFSQFDIELLSGHCRTEEDVIRLAKHADGILNQYAPIGKNAIRELTRCQVISRYGVGVNTVDLPTATSRGIYVTNVPDYGMEEVSNHALGLLLCLSRKIVKLNAAVKQGMWDFKRGVPIYRLSRQTVGVLGFGRIPRRLVEKLRTFGCRILVYDPYVPEEVIREAGVESASLEAVLRAADYLSVHVPLTDETEHLIDRKALSLMKNGAVIVNTSRGSVIHEQDLIEALQKGEIAAAALDVVEEEPISADHPFLTMGNVILTPHIAWYSEESMEEMRVKAAQNVLDVLQGKHPRYLVNREVICSTIGRRESPCSNGR